MQFTVWSFSIRLAAYTASRALKLAKRTITDEQAEPLEVLGPDFLGRRWATEMSLDVIDRLSVWLTSWRIAFSVWAQMTWLRQASPERVRQWLPHRTRAVVHWWLGYDISNTSPSSQSFCNGCIVQFFRESWVLSLCLLQIVITSQLCHSSVFRRWRQELP